MTGATDLETRGTKLYFWRLSLSLSTPMNAPPTNSWQDVSSVQNCTNDDAEFIRNVKAGNEVEVTSGRKRIVGDERVVFLWHALDSLPLSLRERVFLDFLQGSDSEDIWLWIDGDEAFMKGLDCWNPPSWRSAAAALEARHARPPPMQSKFRQRVQSAEPEMRAAMICWLAITSTAYKNADRERGGRDREVWDLRDLLREWWWWLSLEDIRRWLLDHPADAVTVTAMMNGHTCSSIAYIQPWLLMRSQLGPDPQHAAVYLGDKDCSACKVQLARYVNYQQVTELTPIQALNATADLNGSQSGHLHLPLLHFG